MPQFSGNLHAITVHGIHVQEPSLALKHNTRNLAVGILESEVPMPASGFGHARYFSLDHQIFEIRVSFHIIPDPFVEAGYGQGPSLTRLIRG